ncbi:hypothetical protein EYF80_023919 [Liparis tanakae]|uniref:Uncharacterized protein n=1 Tax=Liparis tanakae TaxID=230148 RepID=A0A4Z2HJ36_9TELE|nr:hypothetical protein EYF80_023919 [Liparis tanakae]
MSGLTSQQPIREPVGERERERESERERTGWRGKKEKRAVENKILRGTFCGAEHETAARKGKRRREGK